MQNQKSLKLLIVLFVILILDVPKVYSHKRKQGKTTTRGTPAPTQSPPTQGANSDAAKLSYGNQGPPPAQGNYQNHNQPPSPYQPYGQNAGHPGAPPPYSPNPSYPSQPGYHQPAPGQQPIIVNHVQQPQSSGGLGTAGGLALGQCHVQGFLAYRLTLIYF